MITLRLVARKSKRTSRKLTQGEEPKVDVWKFGLVGFEFMVNVNSYKITAGRLGKRA
jgi:hypothetical protein